MLARERQERILFRVRSDGSARVAELTTEFGVSEMTIRRDLDQLDARGLLEKVHGGATLPRQALADEPGFTHKSRLNLAEKRAIAHEAASLIGSGWAVGFGGGTTTWQVAKQLGVAAVAGLTIVTNSLRAATAIDPEGIAVDVILTGGLRTPSDALVGPVALHTVRSLHLDALVLGTHGFDPDRGLTTPNLMESEINRAMIDAANRLIVVADSSKWGVCGLSTFAQFREIDTLVIDSGLGQSAQTMLERAGVDLHLVDAHESAADEDH